MLRFGLAGLLCCISGLAAAADKYDIVVYGGTSGGVVAALQAAEMGKTVVLIEPSKHLGGLTAGGLGATDIGNKGAIGGRSRQFYKALGKHYGKDEMWTFEPSVAEKLMDSWAKHDKIKLVREQRLDLKSGVKKEGGRIVEITMETGEKYAGQMFIDATYEGDLMAKAGVSYHVGREANAKYNETLNGVQLGSKSHQFKVKVDPYRTPGDPKSGLLPGIHDGDPGKHGEGDHRVQAYNFRICMTDVPENRMPFPKPEGYDPLRYELLARYIAGGVFDVFGNSQRMPNGKTDTNNNGGFSSDNIGMNYDYPDGDYATREKIFAEHVTYHQGMLWFLANDERMPENVKKFMSKWGLAKDEFVGTGGWPHQLYVREARRMISDYVMTQHNCQGRVLAEDSVGMAAYGMDSHNTQRYVKNGYAVNEGDVQVHGFKPYPISYRSIVPKQSECENLLVPVCVSSTHISYGSIRMEPVFMVLGQSAATAACQAIDDKVAVQKIDYAKLKERLLADGQILAWTATASGAASHGEPAIDPEKLAGVVVDDDQAEFVGDWVESRTTDGYVGAGYRHDNAQGRAEGAKEKIARFKAKVREAGEYEVRLAFTPLGNRATNVPVTIISGGQSPKTVEVNQRQASGRKKGFVTLAKLELKAGAEVTVAISNRNADGHVIADAVQLAPVKSE